MVAVERVSAEVTEHIEGYVERPHPDLGGQPVCPFAKRARRDNRVEITVVPFSADDDSAVTWAVQHFDRGEKDVLLVVHPDPNGVRYPELAELRDRFAAHLAGRYEVFTGHPDDPYTLAGVRTRREPYPTLHFVKADTLAAAERQLGPHRRALHHVTRQAGHSASRR